MNHQELNPDCGCETTCCDRQLGASQTEGQESSVCCTPTAAHPTSCGCGEPATTEAPVELHQSTSKQLNIEFLYLDLSVCTRCQGTEATLETAMNEVSGILQATGVVVNIKKIHVQDEEQAHQLGFVTSPTIRLNGRDVQLDFRESSCGSCGEMCGEDVACRVWIYHGQEYTVPPKAMVIEAILQTVYGNSEPGLAASWPKPEVSRNLNRFFNGKRRQAIVQ